MGGVGGVASLGTQGTFPVNVSVCSGVSSTDDKDEQPGSFSFTAATGTEDSGKGPMSWSMFLRRLITCKRSWLV